MSVDMIHRKHRINTHWFLLLYDLLVLFVSALIMLAVYDGAGALASDAIILNGLISLVLIFSVRFFGGVYRQVWRYGGVQCYIRLILTDGAAFLLHRVISSAFLQGYQMIFPSMLSLYCINLLGALAIRLFYRYAYKCGMGHSKFGRLAGRLYKLFSFGRGDLPASDESSRIRVAIVGAGRVGVSLAEELLNNRSSLYVPRCFIDTDVDKSGREIHNLPVYPEDDTVFSRLQQLEVQEVIFAIPALNAEKRREKYEYYKKTGCRLKVYDYPVMQQANGKRTLREFDIEELLFRKEIRVLDEKTAAFYQGKTVLVTGGGGSIGSELCRQVAGMKPKKLVCLDVYENGAYDVQQELKMRYGTELDFQVEICSVTNRPALEKVFAAYHPDLVIHAAAHKHVPLMEHNPVEAVENNVFGTLNAVELAEKYEAEHFIMVSTDKAVNPTNIMGATKRMCEMIVMAQGRSSNTIFSATRFGNVLGSAGSVIPLFRRQIASGGPITLTDKRIIRYFMTIPEASQLVLQSGAMARSNELFVLDMGKPIRIYELAENMVRLAGFTPDKDIEIREIGLRPGEKLYEELLIHTEECQKTENDLIFIEHETPLEVSALRQKLELLRQAVAAGRDEEMRWVMHQVVPTFRTPEEVNKEASKAQEMINAS